MKAITIPVPGDADALVLADVPAPEPGPTEVLVDVAAAGGQPRRPDAAPGLLRPAAGRLAVPRPGGAAARSPPSATEVAGLVGRRRGVRAAGRRRVRRAGGGPGRPAAAGAGRACRLSDAAALPEVACTVWSNVFMTAQPAARRDAARARRLQRHRHHGHPARPRGRRPRRGHRRQRRPSWSAAASWAPRSWSTTASRTSSRCCASHRRRRRRRHPGQHGREVPRPQRRRARGQRPARRHRPAGRGQGRAGPGRRCCASGPPSSPTSLRARPPAEKAAIVAAVREHVWPLIEPRAGAPDRARHLPAGGRRRRPPASWRPARTSARCCSLPEGGSPGGAPGN